MCCFYARATTIEAVSLRSCLITTPIAMKEAEHRELIRTRFPAWEEQVTYWNVHDIDVASPRDAIGVMDRLVMDLIREIKTVARG